MNIQIEKLNVKDEIISGEPRYNIKNNTGTILYENVDVSFITQLLQQGTPINKALFDKIDRNFENISDNFGKMYVLINSQKRGKDIETFIKYGEYNGIKTPQLYEEIHEKEMI